MSQPIGDEGTDVTDRCECKLGSVMDAYTLEWDSEVLVDRWMGDGTEQMSLRELAAFFNTQVLQAAVRESELELAVEEIETMYTLLMDDDVSDESRSRARDRLRRAGIDPDELVEDFVSYQTINRHLKQCVGVRRESESKTDDQYIRRRVQRIYALENKLDVITHDVLDQLDNTDRISLSDFETSIEVHVRCSYCGAQHKVGDIVENHGCLCESDDE